MGFARSKSFIISTFFSVAPKFRYIKNELQNLGVLQEPLR